MTTREISISRGMVALVDNEDYDRIAPFKWYARPADQKTERWYACRSTTVAEVERTGAPRSTYMHRAVLLAPPHLLVDHINGDGLDNRRANLRLATSAGNSINRVYGPTQSGYRGVHNDGRKFWAQIEVAGTIVKVRGCPNPEFAARAYDALAREFQGGFAIVNFPIAKIAASQ